MHIQFHQLVCTSHWTQKELSIFKYNMHVDIPIGYYITCSCRSRCLAFGACRRLLKPCSLGRVNLDGAPATWVIIFLQGLWWPAFWPGCGEFLDPDDVLDWPWHHRGDTSEYTEFGHAQIRSFEGSYPSLHSHLNQRQMRMNTSSMGCTRWHGVELWCWVNGLVLGLGFRLREMTGQAGWSPADWLLPSLWQRQFADI